MAAATPASRYFFRHRGTRKVVQPPAYMQQEEVESGYFFWRGRGGRNDFFAVVKLFFSALTDWNFEEKNGKVQRGVK